MSASNLSDPTLTPSGTRATRPAQDTEARSGEAAATSSAPLAGARDEHPAATQAHPKQRPTDTSQRPAELDQPLEAAPLKSSAERHLWEFAWVRDLLWIVGAIVTLWLFIGLRLVTAPLTAAFVFAYTVEPLVKSARDRFGIPRVATATIFGGLMAIGLAVTGVVAIPQLATQLSLLNRRLPRYVELIEAKLLSFGLDVTGAETSLLPGVDTAQAALQGAGQTLSVISSFMTTAVTLVVVVVFTMALFLYFSATFDQLPDIRRYLPASRRDALWDLISKIERVFAGFVRGQIAVAAFTSSAYSLGFWLIGVPYWAVPALIGGLLSVIPNGQAAGPLLAITFLALEASSTGAFSWGPVLVYPLIVYALMQSMETFVITPLVQGSATRMHPLAVLGALLAGASVGGIVGILLAIPVAASARILLEDIFFPWLAQQAKGG